MAVSRRARAARSPSRSPCSTEEIQPSGQQFGEVLPDGAAQPFVVVTGYFDRVQGGRLRRASFACPTEALGDEVGGRPDGPPFPGR